jgi:hypothetical protein
LQKLNYDAELLAAQTALAVLNSRVFSGGAEDVNNAQLKGYSAAYAKKREKAGRQTAKKDLIFTGALFESIQVGTSNNLPAMGFLTENEAKVAGYQEEQSGVKTFALNDSERAFVANEVKDFVIGKLGEIVKRWS